MIVYPASEQAKFEKILDRFPYSKISTQKVNFKGETYVSVRSTDLDLMICIAESFSINKDPEISKL